VSWWLGGTPGADGHLVLLAPGWVGWAAVALAALAWMAAFPGRRAWWAALAELAAWGAALAGVVFAVLQPVWVEEEGRTEPGRVAVLVDASRSMSVLENGRPRSDSIEAIRRALGVDEDRIDWYHFGDDLAVGAPAAFDLPGTDLEGALDALGERVAGERLAGIAVATDGLDRGLLRRRWAKEPDALPPVVPGPLTVYQVGAPAEITDLSVRSVDTGGFAFIRHPFHLVADIEGVGYAGRTVPVTLLRDGASVTTKSAVLDDDGRANVDFEIVPEDDGRFTYGVSVPVFEGDAVPSNNQLPLVVRVVRDKIRVLQVAGAPSWDVKFLRRFLKSDPSVDLISFFILRTEEDMRRGYPYDDRELSLIAFPYEDLFDKDLWTFDIVIFQNFDYRNYFQQTRDANRLLGNVARYVNEGGAFVMVGGNRSFELGEYGGTPIADILPVSIADGPRPADEASFHPVLTEEGSRHPITRVQADIGDNQLWWEASRSLDGTNVPLRAVPEATVLLSHPTRVGVDGKPMPILAVREVGKGRSLALTVDSSWRWSLSEAAEGRGNQPYLRFWKNALRWLMRDVSVARVSVGTPRENYAVGDEVRIVVQARDPGFAPLEAADVSVEVTTNGETTPIGGRTDAAGEVALVFPTERRGTHRVVAKVSAKGVEVGQAETVFAVTTRDPELDEVSPDADFLRWLAGRSGGAYFAPGAPGPMTIDADAGRTVWDRRETPIWRAPLLGLLVLGCAGSAWWIRRRGGLR
jgi:uncharacterized membrane protein